MSAVCGRSIHFEISQMNGKSSFISVIGCRILKCTLIAPIFAVLQREDTTFNAATPTKPYRQAETSITEVLNERKQHRYSSHVFTVTPEIRKVLESLFAFVCVANKSCHLKVIVLLFFMERISARKIDFLCEKSNTQYTYGSQWSY